MWNCCFGSVVLVNIDRFFDLFKIYFKEEFNINVTLADLTNLRYFFQASSSPSMSQTKFTRFLRAMGPLKACLSKLSSFLGSPACSGFLSFEQVQQLLHHCSRGYYTLRICDVDDFALTGRVRGSVRCQSCQEHRHVILVSNTSDLC